MLHTRHWDSPPKTKREESDANGREGGDDSLVNSSPTDSRSDEKVVVNEQRGDKIVNGPSQTAANTSEGSSYDEEILE
jgi:hypothetical protein